MSFNFSKTSSESTTSLLSPKTCAQTHIRSGIGGRGNFHKKDTLAPASAPIAIPARASGTFLSGIGGAGNSHSFEDRASISSAESLSRKTSQLLNAPTSWHTGIGGRGNRASMDGEGSTPGSSANSSYSNKSVGGASNADKMRNRLSGVFGAKA